MLRRSESEENNCKPQREEMRRGIVVGEEADPRKMEGEETACRNRRRWSPCLAGRPRNECPSRINSLAGNILGERQERASDEWMCSYSVALVVSVGAIKLGEGHRFLRERSLWTIISKSERHHLTWFNSRQLERCVHGSAVMSWKKGTV